MCSTLLDITEYSAAPCLYVDFDLHCAVMLYCSHRNMYVRFNPQWIMYLYGWCIMHCAGSVWYPVGY